MPTVVQEQPKKKESQTRVIVKGKLVKLRARKLPAGGETLYLDYKENGKRKYDFLSLHLVEAKTSFSRQQNKDTQLMAERIRSEREILLSRNGSFVKASVTRKADFLAFLEEYIGSYSASKKEIGIYRSMKRHFVLFTGEPNTLPFAEITPKLCLKFKNYLDKSCNGVTPHQYFKKFRRTLKQAVTEGLIGANPAADVVNKRSEGITKEVLSMAEIQKMASEDCGNPEVKRAFLFSCVTGLRYCDIKVLEWQSVKGSSVQLKQQKTGKGVVINLNSTALKLLGKRPEGNELIFTLPSYSACSENLHNWAGKSKINKKVTWHCARHSFATNLLIVGADVRSVSGLLGHSSLVETQKYVRLVEALKEKAVEQLPELHF